MFLLEWTSCQRNTKPRWIGYGLRKSVEIMYFLLSVQGLSRLWIGTLVRAAPKRMLFVCGSRWYYMVCTYSSTGTNSTSEWGYHTFISHPMLVACCRYLSTLCTWVLEYTVYRENGCCYANAFPHTGIVNSMHMSIACYRNTVQYKELFILF